MYVIATDSRKRSETLFMVDRRKQRKSFWSHSTVDAFVYADREAAQTKCDSLRFNNPRVMTLAEAEEISRGSDLERIHEQALADSEMGWDGHKSWT